MKVSLAERMRSGGYDGYSYAYPHKTAYRPLDPPIQLSDAWLSEDKNNIFLYVHLPFCEMRCGFCNLFTTVQPGNGLVDATIRAIQTQSEIVADAIAPQKIAQAAFGGGTPSFLSVGELENLLAHLERTWPVSWKNIPVSFELSPATVTYEKLELLKHVGVDRVSVGIQSFVREDLIALKRPQDATTVHCALELIASANFPVFNIDLIYGNEGQDAERWERTLRAALSWGPQELYLYPLYIRPLTNLERSSKQPGEHRRSLYLQARDFLCANGYRQISMRLFRRREVLRHSDYCCQDDGMVGLGPGARSYTRALHYSSEYAVAQSEVRGIIEKFNCKPAAAYARADYGVHLKSEEQKLRYVIKSLLRTEGLSHEAYRERFGTESIKDAPALNELIESGLAENNAASFHLNADGIAWSDTIGPWLYSDAVASEMASFELV